MENNLTTFTLEQMNGIRVQKDFGEAGGESDQGRGTQDVVMKRFNWYFPTCHLT